MIYLLVFLAGGTGALLRFYTDGIINRLWQGSMPVATFFINATGSFLLGLLTGLLHTLLSPTVVSDSFVITENLSLVIGSGFLGGFTTFSTAMLEAARSQTELYRAVLTGGQAIFCIICAAAGLALTF